MEYKSINSQNTVFFFNNTGSRFKRRYHICRDLEVVEGASTSSSEPGKNVCIAKRAQNALLA